MVINARRVIGLFLLILLVIAGVYGVKSSLSFFYEKNYPHEYEEYVLKYAKAYDIDPDIVWAVIKTESDFDPNATSNVGARGLMQIMEDTCQWIKTKLDDDTTTFEQMYDPETNIRFGSFFISYLYREFGSYETAIAAYHAGRGAAGQWLKNEEYSKDGVTLDKIPIDDTEYYVYKVMSCYEMYQKIYES